MATKSKSKTKDNKNLIIGICAAVVVVVAIIITVVLVSNNTLNDSYFVSDDTKYVFTLDSEEGTAEEGEVSPLKTHLVYTYEGDKITSLKSYYVFADANAAKTAFDKMKEAGGEEANGIELNGKYIIISAEEDDYKNLTAADVKQQIEFMESLKNMDNNPQSDVTNESEVES